MCADAAHLCNITLAFVRKTRVIVAVAVGNDRKWNVLPKTQEKDEDVERIFSPETFTIVWTSSKFVSHQSIKTRFNSPNTLINYVPGVCDLSYDKWQQYLILQEYLKEYQTSLEQLRIMPATFLLQKMANHIGTLKASKPNSAWITKQCVGYGGMGTRMFRNTAALEEFLISSNYGCNDPHCIVQEYISDVLLINQKKFDIRVPLLIASARPFMLYCHDGYLRVALKSYDPNGAALDAHLTAPVHNCFDPEEHFWSFSKFQAYLDIHYPNNGDFVQNVLIPNIKKMAILFIKSGNEII